MLNQFTVPELAVALSVTVPVPHRDAGVVAVIVGIGFTVIMAEVLLADAHAPLVTTARYCVVTVKLVAV